MTAFIPIPGAPPKTGLTNFSGGGIIGYCQKSHRDGQGIGIFDDHSVRDPEEGRLTLKWRGKKTVEFTVGSSFYYDEGVRKYLGYELYAVDGVPMIPVRLIAEKPRMTLSFDGTAAVDVH